MVSICSQLKNPEDIGVNGFAISKSNVFKLNLKRAKLLQSRIVFTNKYY